MRKVKQRATQVFWTNKNGYILALKRLKYMFGLKFQISQASISKLTWGKLISNDDDKSLIRYYYTTSDCVAALKQLNCVYDLHSTDVLRQTIRRLPSKFHNRWAEHCFKIRHICPLNMTQRNGEILVVMRNGLVRPHSVNPNSLCVKKITFFINVNATKPWPARRKWSLSEGRTFASIAWKEIREQKNIH